MKPHASSKVLFTQLPGGDEAVEKLPGSPFLTTVRALRTLLLDVLSPIRDRRYLRPRLFHEVGGSGYLVVVFSETQRARLNSPSRRAHPLLAGTKGPQNALYPMDAVNR
jgi:hypothetical protein